MFWFIAQVCSELLIRSAEREMYLSIASSLKVKRAEAVEDIKSKATREETIKFKQKDNGFDVELNQESYKYGVKATLSSYPHRNIFFEDGEWEALKWNQKDLSVKDIDELIAYAEKRGNSSLANDFKNILLHRIKARLLSVSRSYLIPGPLKSLYWFYTDFLSDKNEFYYNTLIYPFYARLPKGGKIMTAKLLKWECKKVEIDGAQIVRSVRSRIITGGIGNDEDKALAGKFKRRINETIIKGLHDPSSMEQIFDTTDFWKDYRTMLDVAHRDDKLRGYMEKNLQAFPKRVQEEIHRMRHETALRGEGAGNYRFTPMVSFAKRIGWMNNFKGKGRDRYVYNSKKLFLSIRDRNGVWREYSWRFVGTGEQLGASLILLTQGALGNIYVNNEGSNAFRTPTGGMSLIALGFASV